MHVIKHRKIFLLFVNVGRSIHFPILLCIGIRVLIKKKKRKRLQCTFSLQSERHCGLMLGCSLTVLKVSRSKYCFNQNFAYPAANGYLNLFRAGKGFDEEGRRDDHHHSHVMPLEKMERNIHCSCSQAAIELILIITAIYRKRPTKNTAPNKETNII